MAHQAWSTAQSGPHRLGFERSNIERQLATGKSHGVYMRTRWRNSSRIGKTAYAIHLHRFWSCTRVFYVVLLIDFLCSGLRQRELPLSQNLMYWWYWQNFSLKYQSQFQKNLRNNWCLRKTLMPPLCSCSVLSMLLQPSRIRWLKKTPNLQHQLWLFWSNLKPRCAPLTSE